MIPTLIWAPLKQSGYHDIHNPLAGTWRWCAGGPAGHRGWRRSGAGHGLPATYGPAHGTRHFAFHPLAAHWTRSLARVLEARPGGLECWNSVRVGNVIWRLCRELNRCSHAIPQPERIVRLLPNAGGFSALEKSAAGGAGRRPRRGVRPRVGAGGLNTSRALYQATSISGTARDCFR